jgi:hypothetical protein
MYMIPDIITLTYEDIEPYLHQFIQVRFHHEVILDAELTEVVRLGKFDELPREPFSFIIRTNQKNEYYPQATYIILHPVKGEIAVFLVPIGPDNIGMRYQAIFN